MLQRWFSVYYYYKEKLFILGDIGKGSVVAVKTKIVRNNKYSRTTRTKSNNGKLRGTQCEVKRCTM